jgi:hypothetical protein
MRRLAQPTGESKVIDNELLLPDSLVAMGEYKAKIDEPQRLLVRLQFPTHEPMVVEAELAVGSWSVSGSSC